MSSDIIIIDDIKSKIFTIRGLQVMLDFHLAEIYNVETRRLNEQVKRNINRFPERFMFQLNHGEWDSLKSQIATSRWGGTRKLPNVFTEQGIAMLSSVLKSDTAVEASIMIMDAFIIMRKILIDNASVFQRLDRIELKQLESDHKFKQIFDAIANKKLTPAQGIFYNGEIFDAYQFVSDLIRTAEKSIILIDNYANDTVLTLMSKRKEGVQVKIYMEKIKESFKLDIEKFNSQYEKIEVKIFKHSHDRFLIIDEKEVYHIGASLKDLGKKWFAFSKLEIPILELLEKM